MKNNVKKKKDRSELVGLAKEQFADFLDKVKIIPLDSTKQSAMKNSGVILGEIDEIRHKVSITMKITVEPIMPTPTMDARGCLHYHEDDDSCDALGGHCKGKCHCDCICFESK